MEPTIMKQLNFKKIFLNLLWPLLPFTAQAQENNTLYSILSKDSILVSSPSVQNQEEDIVTQMPNRHHKYDKRVHRYRRAWEALIPTHTKLQYAGGMGLLSWGIGWDYGKRGQWETDLLLGFIPRYSSKHFKMTMTLKQNYIPWSIWLGKDFSLEPLTTGIYFNTVFSHDFWTSEPERYPRGYYGFSTRIRTHIFLGQRVRFDVPEKYRKFSKSITAFYEISTCDLYVVSAFNNSYLKPDDYLRLSFGLKFQIF